MAMIYRECGKKAGYRIECIVLAHLLTQNRTSTLEIGDRRWDYRRLYIYLYIALLISHKEHL